MEEFDLIGQQAHDVTQNFILAINGVFFASRKVGIRTMPCDIEIGKRNIHTASYLFNKNLKGLINIYDNEADAQVTQDRLNSIAVQLVKKANHAVTTGVTNGAASLLGNNAHGAMGQLVARTTQTLDLSVMDSAGRTWKDPSKLVQTIVRDFLYQREVKQRIDRLKEEGALFFLVGNHGYSIDLFNEVRPRLFHPNSTNLPEHFNV